MFYQIFLSPQVKRSAIISNKHGICELPHEFPNDLSTQEKKKDLGSEEIKQFKKITKLHRIIT